MNLLEIQDEFAEIKITPEEELAALVKREKSVRHNIHVLRDQQTALRGKIIGQVIPAPWNARIVGKDDEGIKQQVNNGYTYTTVYSPWTAGEQTVDFYYPNIPQNEKTVEHLKILANRLKYFDNLEAGHHARVKRTKARLSAWKRKQPTYVGRKTGKELLVDIKAKIEDFIASKTWPVTINNSYYWAKNKMIVIDIPVREPINGKSTIDAAKQIVKPDLTKFLEELGYSQFRVIDKFDPTSRFMLIKIQLDDVEARNKAANKEPKSST